MIDLYYAHRIDQNTPIEETIETMSLLVKEGRKIKYLGLSECTAEELKKLTQFIQYQPYKVNTHFFREVEKELLPLTKN